MEYRAFITTIGNGIAGPAYGMFTLQEALNYRKFRLPDDFLRTPFPHLSEYNPHEDPKLAEYWERSRNRQVTKEEYEARKLKEIMGALGLCHEGCGYFHLLVVSGPLKGQMWIDATVSDVRRTGSQSCHGHGSWYLST